MVWWKESFEKLESEIELVKKKRTTLDNLLSSGRISQSTFDYYSKELEEIEKDIEIRRKTLIEKVNSRMENLEKQLQVLEMLFADVELSHVVGELDEETYARHRDMLTSGLDFARKELEGLKEFALNLENLGAEQPPEQAPLKSEEQEFETPTEEIVEEITETTIEEQVSTELPELPEVPSGEEGTQEPTTYETVETPEASSEDLTFQTAANEEETVVEESEESIESQN